MKSPHGYVGQSRTESKRYSKTGGIFVSSPTVRSSSGHPNSMDTHPQILNQGLHLGRAGIPRRVVLGRWWLMVAVYLSITPYSFLRAGSGISLLALWSRGISTSPCPLRHVHNSLPLRRVRCSSIECSRRCSLVDMQCIAELNASAQRDLGSPEL